MPGARIRILVIFFILANVSAQYDYSDSGEGDNPSAEKSDSHGFVEPLDFTPLFSGGYFGLSGAASHPSVNLFQKAPEKQPSIFDVGSAESQVVFGGSNFFQGSSPDKDFAPENFGFIPVLSQGLALASDSLPKRYQEKTVAIERTKATTKAATINRTPINFDINTKHDNSYKKLNNPAIASSAPSAAYNDGKSQKSEYFVSPTISEFQPSNSKIVKNDNIPPYKKYGFQSDLSPPPPTYQALTYQGYQYPQLTALDSKLFRYKRYSSSRNNNAKSKKPQKNKKQQEEYDDDEDSYDIYAPYKSRPKEFDEGPYATDFDSYEKAELKSSDDYDSDDDYGTDEYERIKSLSEKQAAEASKNPENCKKVQRDSMTCNVCTNPKTGGSYESCSYESQPKNNKYAYVKEQKFDSEDDPENQEESKTSENTEAPESRPARPTSNSRPKPYGSNAKYQKLQNIKKAQKPIKYYPYEDYDTQGPIPSSSTPVKYQAYKQQEEDDEDDKNSEEKDEDSDEDHYKSSIPNFFTDNEPKKNVESVLAEFVKKDRSNCKKVFKNEMTCYQCVDKSGLKNEECMFVSESAPKSSHLAYKEIKEFNSKPTPQTQSPRNSEGAESQVISKPAAILPSANPTYLPTETTTTKLRKNLSFKKFRDDGIPKKSSVVKAGGHLLSQQPTAPTSIPDILKRNVRSSRKTRSEKKALDDIAPPSEFASVESRGAFWADTEPMFSRALGVSLPAYMLSKSEHEVAIDEMIASG